MTAAAPSLGPTNARKAREAWTACGLLAAATVVNLLLERYVSVTSQAMIYVLAVVLASYTLAWVPSLFCAIAAVTLLNFFFIPPRYTFQVEAQENLFALFAMLARRPGDQPPGNGLAAGDGSGAPERTACAPAAGTRDRPGDGDAPGAGSLAGTAAF